MRVTTSTVPQVVFRIPETLGNYRLWCLIVGVSAELCCRMFTEHTKAAAPRGAWSVRKQRLSQPKEFRYCRRKNVPLSTKQIIHSLQVGNLA